MALSCSKCPCSRGKQFKYYKPGNMWCRGDCHWISNQCKEKEGDGGVLKIYLIHWSPLIWFLDAISLGILGSGRPKGDFGGLSAEKSLQNYGRNLAFQCFCINSSFWQKALLSAEIACFSWKTIPICLNFPSRLF